MAPPVRGVLSVLGAFLIQVILYSRVFRFYSYQSLSKLYMDYISVTKIIYLCEEFDIFPQLTAGTYHGTFGNLLPYFSSYIRKVALIIILFTSRDIPVSYHV